MTRRIALLAATAALALVPAQGAQAQEGLSLAKQGYLFAGGKYITVNGRQVLSGQMYVEYQIPRRRTQPYPIVIIPGAAQTATNFTGTPDGREGWAQYFVRRGYAVYVVDGVGRGRSAHWSDVHGPVSKANMERLTQRFVAPERYKLWPQAHLHTQWPGEGKPGDFAFEQFYFSQMPSIVNYTKQQEINPPAIIALLEKIGPSILVTHSQSGAFAWPVVDQRPDLVRANIAVEPNGPPVREAEFKGAPDWFGESTRDKAYGLGEVRLNYEPAVAATSKLEFVRPEKADKPEYVRCWLQKEPARKLPNLAKVPTLVLVSEASYHASYDHCTVAYLNQAGVKTTFIRLDEVGIRGNGHMMMLEKNNMAIAGVMAGWLERVGDGARRQQVAGR